MYLIVQDLWQCPNFRHIVLVIYFFFGGEGGWEATTEKKGSKQLFDL